jgi:hypothetical protein
MKVNKFAHKEMSSFQVEAFGYIFRLEKYNNKHIKEFFKRNPHIELFGYCLYLYNLEKWRKRTKNITKKQSAGVNNIFRKTKTPKP